LVERVFQWLLDRASLVPQSPAEGHTLETAWNTARVLGFRLNNDQAARLAHAAIEHPAWSAIPESPNHVVLVREPMLQAISRAVPNMSRATAEDVADAIIPLATDRKQIHDYDDAIEALCQLALRGGAKLKAKLRKRLYPRGQKIDAILLQVSDLFGQPAAGISQLSEAALTVAENVRLQVQRLPVGTEATTANGTLFTITAEEAGRKLVVNYSSPVDVFAVVRHRSQVSEKSFGKLIDAILEMIEEPENVLGNKTRLAESLANTGDAISPRTAKRIFDVLAPLARGEIVEPTCTMSAAEASNPLNPFKLGSGKPNELRAAALCSIACIAREKPKVAPDVVSGLIELALVDRDGIVRSAALEAAREAPSLSSSATTAVLIATRDHDANVVCAAFAAIARFMSSRQSDLQWQMLLQSIRFAATASSPQVRRAAAFAVVHAIENTSKPEMLAELRLVRKSLQADRCFSVRQASKPKRKGARPK
jgi:hypothetical protein